MMHDALIYNWKIAGQAGYGIMNTGGPIFAKTLIRAGFYVFVYSEYPSLIRGGHNTMQVAVSKRKIGGVYKKIDQLVALDAHAIVMNQDNVKKGGTIIYDAGNIKIKNKKKKIKEINNSQIPALSGLCTIKKAKAKTKLREDLKVVPINLEQIAEEVGGNKIMKNVVAVGASLALVEKMLPATFVLPAKFFLKIGKEVLKEVFTKKGEKIIKANQEVLEAGYLAS